MTFEPQSFLRLAGLREGEIVAFTSGPQGARVRVLAAGRWTSPPPGRETRLQLCADRLRLLGLDRAVARGAGGALAWRAADPVRAFGSITLPLPLSAHAAEIFWETAEAGPGALAMPSGTYLDLSLPQTAHARLGGAFLLGPGWERAIVPWSRRADLVLRIWRWDGAIAVGARVGTSGWAPTLAMPLPSL